MQDKRKVATTVAGGDASRPRKDRDPNWHPLEIMDLVQVKKEEFLEELDCEDQRDLIGPDNTKWGKIAIKVAGAGHSTCVRDGAACKYKWQALYSDFKKIGDYYRASGRSELQYFSLSIGARRDVGLPRSFQEEIYVSMMEWLLQKPTLKPPHSRDLLHPNDGCYQLGVWEHDGDNISVSMSIGDEGVRGSTIEASIHGNNDSAVQNSQIQTQALLALQLQSDRQLGLHSLYLHNDLQLHQHRRLLVALFLGIPLEIDEALLAETWKYRCETEDILYAENDSGCNSREWREVSAKLGRHQQYSKRSGNHEA